MRHIYETNRIYKDNVNKKVMGVCSGIAKHYGVETWIVRLTAILAFFMFPGAIAIAYVVATLLLPTR